MTDSRLHGARHAWLAALWFCLMIAVTVFNGWYWLGGHYRLETDILAMLPQDSRDTQVRDATRKLADSAARRIVVLVGAPRWSEARDAGDRYAAALARSGAPVTLRYTVTDQESAGWIDFYSPYRQQLLTSAQVDMLGRESTPALAQRALAGLYQPMGMPRLGRWQEDPLNLFGQWLGERAGQSRIRVVDERLSLSTPTRSYALIMLEQNSPAFSVSGNLSPLLDQTAREVRRHAPDVDIVTAGIPLFAAAAASQAQHEVHTIGAGSLLGIILLTVLAFNGLRPRLLVTVSLFAGLGTAITVTALLFGKLHLITLVFGASLIGVAENYGNNYYAYRLGRPASERWAMLRQQRGVMCLAFMTTAIGYALLALTPFPGLMQMAVFSVSGLLAAFLTVLLCLPYVDAGTLPFNRFAHRIGGLYTLWPDMTRRRNALLAGAACLLILLAGLFSIKTNDDIRLLQNASPRLIQEQRQVGQLLDMPSPGQFFLIEGASPELVLQREEALKSRLAPLLVAGEIKGVQSVSDWVPSARRQCANFAKLEQTIYAPGGVVDQVNRQLGETEQPRVTRTCQPLSIDSWLASPVSEPLRAQWLGKLGKQYASIVMLRGLDNPAKLPALHTLAQEPGVRFIDKVAEISALLAHYRQLMSGVIVLSYALVFGMLWWHFGRQAWRALLPTALASLLTIALLAVTGHPIQLFNILALLLILGMGVDYGVFLLAETGENKHRAFLSVTLAAAGTLLAFGLLALSATPALSAFGLTMLLGISLAWWLNPFFMPPPPSNHSR